VHIYIYIIFIKISGCIYMFIYIGKVKLKDCRNHRPLSLDAPVDPVNTTARQTHSNSKREEAADLDGILSELSKSLSESEVIDLNKANSATQLQQRLDTLSVSSFLNVDRTEVLERYDDISDSDMDSLESDDDLSVSTAEVNIQGVKRSLLMQIEQFSVDSTRSTGYEIVRNNVGDRVYSDRALKWTHLPEQLKLQLCIRTPCDDIYMRCKQLLQFTVNRPCLVMVLVDMRSVKGHKGIPKWLLEDGFKQIGDQAIARVVHHGVLLESFYGIFGKYFGKGEVVHLKSNWSKEIHSMYGVFIIPTPSPQDLASPKEITVPPHGEVEVPNGDPIGVISSRKSHQDIRRVYEEIMFDHTYQRDFGGQSWIEGANGLTLFNADEDVVSIGVKMGTIWSEEFSINMVTSPHQGSFEAVDWESLKAYQLSYSMCQMPGLFSSTQLLTITPRYCIVNCLEASIMVVQRGSREILEIASYQAEGWHKSRASLGTSVQIRSAQSLWSLGSVDLSEVGRSVIHLPRREVFFWKLLVL
jgi:hypothetical protein